MASNGEEVTEDDEAEWYLRRMDAGLSSLQNADYVLGWVCMEDDGVSFHQSHPWLRDRKADEQALLHARVLLARKNKSFRDLVAVLEGMSLLSCFVTDQIFRLREEEWEMGSER